LLTTPSPAVFERAEIILQKMEEIGQKIGRKDAKGHIVATPDYFTYWSLMKNYLRQGRNDYTEKAYNVLSRMEYSVNEGYCNASLTNIYDRFNRSLIFAKPPSQQIARRHAYRCENAFLEMSKPDTKTFNRILHLFAKSNTKGSAIRAEQLLLNVSDWYLKEEKYSQCKPDMVSFNTVLDAYAEMGEGAKAEAMMKLMDDLYSMGISDFQPDLVSHISTFSAWCKGSERDPHECAQKADDMLNLMLQKYNSAENCGTIKPQLFVMAIRAWGQCKSEEGVLRAEKLLSDMVKHSLEPNTFVYNAFLNTIAISNMDNADIKASNIIEDMKRKHANGMNHVKPDLVSYTSYIKALLASADENVVMKTLRVIQQLEKDFDEGISDIELDAKVYSTLMTACNKIYMGGYQAEKILQHMEERFDAGHVKSKPTLFSYTRAMTAWLTASDPIRGERAFALLCKCEETSFKEEMTLWQHNLVLDVCASVTKTNQKQKNTTMRIAIEVFKKIKEHPKIVPNGQTYYALFQACANLIPNKDKQRQAIEGFFNHCTKDGMLNFSSFRLLQRCCSAKFQHHLFGGNNKKMIDMPEEWIEKRERNYRS